MSYYNGQIIFDRDKQEPVQVGDDTGSRFAWGGLPKRNTHFIKDGDKLNTVVTFLPESIAQAKELLRKGIIVPAPVDTEHCWRCGHWLCAHDGKYKCPGPDGD